MELELRARQPTGDDIDLDAAIAAAVDVAAGTDPSSLLHLGRVRRRRDLSVLVLVDVSGSAADGAPDGRRVHDHQVEAALALVETLAALGDRVALHTFRSNGRTEVELTRIKWFDEPVTQRTRGRLAEVQPRGNTRLGAAVRHATHLVERHGGTRQQLLVLLSDGFAFDQDYRGDHARADARRALLEARQQGIGCLCLSIAAPDPVDDLVRVFGASAHASVDALEVLVPSLNRLFRDALATAERTRRRYLQEHSRVPTSS